MNVIQSETECSEESLGSLNLCEIPHSVRE